jgi:hypothetical protein
VARISELERALTFRTQSRPVSLAASDVSSGTPEPTGEMLRLIADLKAERDELKCDIDGWRTRVADLEKQIGALALRVDSERREAWLARERVGLLEIEKRAAVRAVEETAAAVSNLQAELTTTKANFRAIQEDAERSKEVAHELERVRAQLAEERRRRDELEKALEDLSLFNAATPIVPGRRVMSIDSLGSATEVDSLDGHMLLGPELKAVQEVDEDEESYSDRENNLMGYEDEEEGDDSFASHDGSPPSAHWMISHARPPTWFPLWRPRHLAHPHLHPFQCTRDIPLFHASGHSLQRAYPMRLPRNTFPRKLIGSSDALKTLVIHHQPLLPLRKLRTHSPEVSSVQLMITVTNYHPLCFPQTLGSKLSHRLLKILLLVPDNGSMSSSKRRNPRIP